MSDTIARGRTELRQRARDAGIQTSYRAPTGRLVVAGDATLEAILAGLQPPGDAGHRPEGALERVLVARGRSRMRLVFGEDNHEHGSIRLVALDEQGLEIELSDYVRRDERGLSLDISGAGLSIGYYELHLDRGERHDHSLLIVAPRRLPSRELGAGIFTPVYGLREENDFGVGSFGSLGRFGDLVSSQGVEFVATLPCYATFLDDPGSSSPYLPVSRLAWNELFIDPVSVPEFKRCKEAQELLASRGMQALLERLRSSNRVDYGESTSALRGVLELLAGSLAEMPAERRIEFDRFVEGHPEIAAYAEFRAREVGRDGGSGVARSLFHTYAQFAAAEQLEHVAACTQLYLDFPVGVHPLGFDVAQWPGCFHRALSAGAPPDDFFSEGQFWGFAPFNPDGLRAQGYAYLIAAYRHVFQYARLLRIDHVMGFQRIWVVPDGFAANDGAYLTYPSSELRAVALLEAARANVAIVGEDLGTVSSATMRGMDQDGMLHSVVYRFVANADDPLPNVRPDSVVSFATHDLARFAAFVAGADLDERAELSNLTADELVEERLERARWVGALRKELGVDDAQGSAVLYRALLARLGEERPRGILLDLGDCLGEIVPENHPGVDVPGVNWTHRTHSTVEELAADDQFLETLRVVSASIES